jgi:hypothetical protein
MAGLDNALKILQIVTFLLQVKPLLLCLQLLYLTQPGLATPVL